MIITFISVIAACSILASSLDFTLLNVTVNFTDTWPGIQTVLIELNDDNVLEGGETFILSVVPVLVESMPYIIRPVGDSVTITITDAEDSKYKLCW